MEKPAYKILVLKQEDREGPPETLLELTSGDANLVLHALTSVQVRISEDNKTWDELGEVDPKYPSRPSIKTIEPNWEERSAG
jgi:hypothetical protein